MKLHEYQAKALLAKFGVPLPKGRVASSSREAADIADELGVRVVVKAQIHAGGRGRGGGIKLVSSSSEASQAAEAILGSQLVTYQTGPEGMPVRHVLVEEAVDAERELYVGIVIDGAAGGVVVIASKAGGVEIEEVAAQSPEKILRVTVDPVLGLQPYQGRKLAYGMNVGSDLARSVAGLIGNLYRAFETYDCSLAEINPLVITKDSRALAVDVKLNIDDDAIFRHPELGELDDTEQADALEVQAREHDINYVKLHGNVGCMVNGAGLAMATMDVTSAAGAGPANFLDVGGGATEEKISQALRIILADPGVDRVLVNIFGGILRCDVAARGLLMAAADMPRIMPPMVVRMLGTNAEEGRRILSESGLHITFVNDLNQAAEAIKAAA